MPDPAALAREIIDSSQYLTLATADEDGRPWASPVWFVHEEYSRFVWVSKPDARHSRNLSTRPQTGIVIFDSTVPMGGARAVYVEAEAHQLEDEEAERSIALFSRRSEGLGGPSWTMADIRPPALVRIYRADASAHFVLGPRDERIAVSFAR